MPIGYLSEGTTDFTSDVSVAGRFDALGAAHLGSTLSVRGATTLHGALNSASAISGGALVGSSLQVGSGAAVTVLSRITQSVVALTISCVTSTDTTFTLTSATTAAANPQSIIVGAPSALSANIVFSAYVSGTNQGTLRLSATTTANVAQTAQVWSFTLLGY